MDKERKNLKIGTLILNEELKKEKKFNLWTNEEVINFIVDNKLYDYSDKLLSIIISAKEEISKHIIVFDKEDKFNKRAEQIKELESKGFIVVYEIPEVTRDRTIYDSGIISHSGEKICTRGTVLLHPKKSIYMTLEHVIYESGYEEVNQVMGYMIVDKNECRQELIDATNNRVFWSFSIDILENDNLMIGFLSDGFYYCSKLVNTFLNKTCDFSFPLADSHLHLFSDDGNFYNDIRTKQIISKRIEAMNSQFRSYFTSRENIKVKEKSLMLSEKLFI